MGREGGAAHQTLDHAHILPSVHLHDDDLLTAMISLNSIGGIGGWPEDGVAVGEWHHRPRQLPKHTTNVSALRLLMYS